MKDLNARLNEIEIENRWNVENLYVQVLNVKNNNSNRFSITYWDIYLNFKDSKDQELIILIKICKLIFNQ